MGPVGNRLATPLRAVHSKVSAPQEFTPTILLGDTDRGGDSYLAYLGEMEWIREGGCDRVGDLLLGSTSSDEESELIATESGKGPIPFESARESKRCLSQ